MAMIDTALETRLACENWSEHLHRVNASGFSVIENLLDPDVCQGLIDSYCEPAIFRSCINMGSHGFGLGQYKYFAYPLPPIIATLRSCVYPQMVPLANYWNTKLGLEPPYPERHEDFLSQCHDARQERPTPLLLRYGAGDYNCLHRDLYGDILFPVQMAILLSEPNDDFSGGEFVLTEQRPRMQSRVSVVPLRKGDAVIFAVNRRPVKGARGFYSVFTRHGVSEVRAGDRFTLGVIFHDAQ
ncbi:2OG-Fe(II) oxygenase [Pseudomonas salomonii]|uniref:2OG-Fe(II) oxygenase n=2 Tax=Pseudomonas salomonii TaxID=191391 RepID=A0A7Y8KS72_9PSED|nr:2OG-Fe(II) oxygenase [Pseudomonas salomonii]